MPIFRLSFFRAAPGTFPEASGLVRTRFLSSGHLRVGIFQNARTRWHRWECSESLLTCLLPHLSKEACVPEHLRLRILGQEAAHPAIVAKRNYKGHPSRWHRAGATGIQNGPGNQILHDRSTNNTPREGVQCSGKSPLTLDAQRRRRRSERFLRARKNESQPVWRDMRERSC